MKIETVRHEHLGEVKALLDICFGNGAWSADALLSELDKTDSCCTAAVAEGCIVGFLAFEQVLDEGSIVEIAVHPDHRRKGIARELICFALTRADGLRTVFLEVRESNKPARSLYESLGFTQIGVRKDYYDNPKENAIIMRKIL